jgi:V8-like Glu-specific endopeptidase
MLRQRATGMAVALGIALGLPAVALALGVAKGSGHRAARHLQTAHTTAGAPAIGALFATASATAHSCTAAVVQSPRGDLLITAAHCLSGSAAGMVFAPGFRDGASPYGRWLVTGAYLPPGWLDLRSPDRDFAFLTVAPQSIDGRQIQLQQLTGGYRLGSTPPAGTPVTVTGYPAGASNAPITCAARTYQRAGFPAFACGGYVAGTSGSPWLAWGAHGPVIVGVIGGLHQGGCLPYISYSSPLGSAARALYRRALSGARPDVAPPIKAAGCPG